MSCRVARFIEKPSHIALIDCCRCGTTHVIGFWTSKTFGPYLCPICTQSMIESGMEEKLNAPSLDMWFWVPVSIHGKGQNGRTWS
jgi:hypothetical protein